MLFFCGAFLSAGMIPWSSEILFLTAGEAYLSGTVTFSLMLIYPIHQSLGQITNITFYATGRTKSLMYINGAFLLLGMGLTYLVLAPSNMVIPGYNFGSQGLAFKMIIMQLIFVNISSWVLSKEFGWKFNWLYQVKIISVCLIVSQSIFYFSNLKYFDAFPVYLKITIFSICYFLITAGLVMKKREEVGIERSIF